MAAMSRNSTFAFVFSDGTRLGRCKSTCKKCIPNLDDISQSKAEIKLLSVSESGRPPSLNFISGFDFGLISSVACHSALAHQILSEFNYPRRSYDVISIFFHDDGRQPYFCTLAFWFEIAYSPIAYSPK